MLGIKALIKLFVSFKDVFFLNIFTKNTQIKKNMTVMFFKF